MSSSRSLFLSRGQWSAVALAASLGLALVPAAGAAKPASRVSPAAADTAHYAVEPVVVTAVAPSSPLTFTTDPRSPRQPVPASDGGDYLKSIPGFGTIRNGGTNGDPVLRGMFGSRINVLTDGGTMLGACPGRMDAPTSYIAPETFDRMTVVKGPETVEWGPGASAGTVRFERMAPTYASPGVHVSSSLTGGAWGRNDQLGELAAGMPRGDVRVSASRAQQDDYRDGDGEEVPSLWSKWNIEGALGWKPTTTSRIELNGGTGDGEARYAGRRMDGTQFLRRTVGARGAQQFGGALRSIDVQASWHDANHIMDNFSLRTPNPMSSMPTPTTSNVERFTWTSRAAATWRWPAGVSAVAGMDQNSNEHRRRMGPGSTYSRVAWIEDAAFANVGVFGEGRVQVAPVARMIGGVRVDFSSAEDRRALIGTVPNPTRGKSRKESLPSGFARAEVGVGPHALVYAGVGHSERFPDYWELISPNRGPAGAVNAFAGVRPERLTQLDAGAQFSAPQARAWLSAYAGRVVDQIVFDYVPGGMMGTTTTARNVLARVAGAETGAAWTVAGAWTFDGSLAYAWGSNHTDGGALAQIPPLDSRVSLSTTVVRDWTFGVLGRFVATQNRFALNQGNVVGRDLGGTPGFGLLAVNAARRLPHGFVVAAGVDNLFDRTYSEHLNLAGDAAFGYPAMPVRIHEPGRTAWIQLKVRS